jgi:hypothetical protein
MVAKMFGKEILASLMPELNIKLTKYNKNIKR